jgi:hypothetical protein
MGRRSMFILGFLMEAGQHFSPGRAVERPVRLPNPHVDRNPLNRV